MSNVNVKSIFAGVRTEVNAALNNEAGIVRALRQLPGSSVDLQWWLNAYSIQECGSLKTISGFLKARTNINLAYAISDTKVNANGDPAKSTDAGAISLREYIEQALSAVEGEDEDGVAIRNLVNAVRYSTLYVVKGFSAKPKGKEGSDPELLKVKQQEWEDRKQFLADFIEGRDITIKNVCEVWANEEQQFTEKLDENGEVVLEDGRPVMVPEMASITISGYESSISKFEAQVVYKTRKVKAENKPKTKTEAQKAEASLKRAADILAEIDFTLIVNNDIADLKEVVKAAARGLGLAVDADAIAAQAEESTKAQMIQSAEAFEEACDIANLTAEQRREFFHSDYHDYYDNSSRFVDAIAQWLTVVYEAATQE